MSKLIKELNFWRAERPSEWKMDEFIRLAKHLQTQLDAVNARVAELEQDTNKIKADAVRQAAEAFKILNGASIPDLLGYADKLERGDV